jgi:hypothetical protein
VDHVAGEALVHLLVCGDNVPVFKETLKVGTIKREFVSVGVLVEVGRNGFGDRVIRIIFDSGFEFAGCDSDRADAMGH